jgi:TolB-like protein
MNSIVEGDGAASVFRKPAYQPVSHPIARIHLFGAMRAVSYLGDDILPRAKKDRALLAYLCLSFGAKVPRARLAQLLWDKADDEQARKSLGTALHEITSKMGPLAGELIESGRATVRLNASACWIDALALLNQSSPAAVRGDLARLCGGKLLEGLDGITGPFDRWLDQYRTRANETIRMSTEARPTGARPAETLLSPPPAVPTDTRQHPLPGRHRLRVAVLPFEGKGTSREESLASSLRHEIAAALARFRWFDVITPISFARRPLVKFTSADLLHQQLDYAVDGVVSRHGQAVEIRVRLLDLTQATQPVWNERYDLPVRELHRLNEMVTPRVVASIDPVILLIEGQPKRREHYGATGLLLLAIPLLHSMERKKFDQAGQLIARALSADPQDAMGLAWSSIWHVTRAAHGWTNDIAGTLAKAEAASAKAIEIDPENAEALAIYAHTRSWRKEFDAAVLYFDRSLRLNPNLALAWALSAVTYCYIGEPNEGLKRLKRYRDLAPFDLYSSFFETAYVLAYLLKGDYEQAALLGRGVVKVTPDFGGSYKPLIAALGHLGRADEAKPYIERLLSLERNFTVKRFGKVYPIKKAADRKRYMDGLRLAGVPER